MTVASILVLLIFCFSSVESGLNCGWKCGSCDGGDADAIDPEDLLTDPLNKEAPEPSQDNPEERKQTSTVIRMKGVSFCSDEMPENSLLDLMKSNYLIKGQRRISCELSQLGVSSLDYDKKKELALQWTEIERQKRLWDKLQKVQYFSGGLELCKPEGKEECPETEDGLKVQYERVCLEGIPCTKFGKKRVQFDPICEGEQIFYYRPFFKNCWNFYHCPISSCNLTGGCTPITDTECYRLAILNTVEDLEKACDESDGYLSDNLCCQLEKPYQACDEYCSVSWQSEFLTVCHKDNCCKDCKYTDRPCMDLKRAKKLMQYMVDNGEDLIVLAEVSFGRAMPLARDSPGWYKSLFNFDDDDLEDMPMAS